MIITCGLLWCFYQLFGLSFWWHPFAAEDTLVSKWIVFTTYFTNTCSLVEHETKWKILLAPKLSSSVFFKVHNVISSVLLNNSLDALILRFEAPDSRNRWDSPLFTIQQEDSLPFEAISDALFKRKAPPPNQSTQSVRVLAVYYMHEYIVALCTFYCPWMDIRTCFSLPFYSNRSHPQTFCTSWTKLLKMS